MSTPLPPAAELEGDSYEIDSGDPYYRFEVTGYEDGTYRAFATIYEDFTFHVPDEYGFDRDEAWEYVEERIHLVHDFLEAFFNVDVIVGSDVPQIEFNHVGHELESPTEEAAVDAIWEHSDLVRFINEMDPGTFGSPYTGGNLTQMFRMYDEEHCFA